MNEKLAYQLREVELYETILVLEAEFPLLLVGEHAKQQESVPCATQQLLCRS